LISLFPDQERLVNKVRDAMKESKSVLMVSPTGSGKTRMAAYMIDAARNKNNKIIFTVPRKDLLEQTSLDFNKHGITHSYIAAEREYNPHSNVYIGMIDTMARRLDRLPKANFIIHDEAHFGEGSRDKVIKHYESSGAWNLGLSATPTKLSGKGLICWYNRMVEGESIRWLIDNKRLSAYTYYMGKTKPDLSHIDTVAGEYNRGQLSDYMEHQGAIVGDCVSDYRKRCMGRLHIVRCASIKHSQMVAESFRSAGIPARHVDGEMSNAERKPVFMAFARRELLVLTFSDLLNFGFDLSQITGIDVCIESSSDLKPSKSLAGQMQFWGRSLRYKDYGAIFNDHVNNCMTHGLPCDEREWSLDGVDKGTGSNKEKLIPVRQCTECDFCSKPSLVCPNCGFVYPVKPRKITHVDGELVEVKIGDKIVKINKDRKKQLHTLINLARKKGIPNAEHFAMTIINKQSGRA